MDLFTSYSFGDLTLRNRMVMASMSRNRAVSGDVPGALAVTHYSQRASAGLIVSEASQVSAQGVGFARTPGIHSAEQVVAWRSITDAVHRAGCLVLLQLWRVGYRISPTDRFHSMSDSDPVSTFAYLARGLISRVGYLHVAEPVRGDVGVPRGRLTALLRSIIQGTFIANGGYDAASARAAIASRSADLASLGIPFLANPDLPRRFREGAPLNRPDPATFYAGEARGYVDYPLLDDTAAASA